jgi:hypothetical protein
LVGPQEVYKLKHSVKCEGYGIGINVVVSGATVDLNNYTLERPRDNVSRGIGLKVDDNLEDVTLMRGTLDGSATGIECTSGCHNLKIHNISLRHQHWKTE